MPAKYSAEELLVQPWSAVKYYAATGNEGECKDSDAVVIDYTPQPDVTKPCTPMPCFYGSYGYSTQSCVISSADGLRQLTSQYLGANKSYAQIDSWWWQNCSGSLFRVTHYELNTCVASKADGDGSFSYKLEIDSSVLWNRRYSDPFCKKEIITASFRYNSTNGCPDTKLWESFYSVDILTTTTLENSLNLGSVIGGIVAGLLLAFGAGAAWYWKTRVGASQPIALSEETPTAVKETWDRDASEITLGISNAKLVLPSTHQM
ncbi:hypothetical protein BCR33DRAFT_343959 [Rhizoclosmatium globosum]|uniref:Uncharacterized protein n=1 Tax=Rhizoclosmatium globosum TaxID=329046 RepID=A0A1Y2C343_9FUNG|nr:hypothetical protein BCR33DRAFT_343959 [Rhizoclosmatium globosum]|eukprot:ORY41304.1 hypothetical protein BCR33DRAFT_343959 [Rhizoclosmatium globosum]